MGAAQARTTTKAGKMKSGSAPWLESTTWKRGEAANTEAGNQIKNVRKDEKDLGQQEHDEKDDATGVAERT